VKYEEVYLKDYETVGELTTALKQYFTFYNTERPHQSHGDRTPAEVYRGIPFPHADGSTTADATID